MRTEMMALSQSDHDVQLTLPGEVESIRPRMVEALERLGYKVLDEAHLTARRGAQGWAGAGCSFDTLDYPTTLRVVLKQLNEVAVLVTFSFEIKHSTIMTGGDRRTLEREAEALAALASQRISVSACSACGTQATGDSRFCRRCGAPLAIDVSELEVFRLTRGTRAALQRLATSGLLLLVTALTSLCFIWTTNPKSIRALAVIVSIFGALGITVLLQGMWRLHSTLNPREARRVPAPAPAQRRSLGAPQTAAAALPPHQTPASITEGTTELLAPHLQEPLAVAVKRQGRDTGPVN